MSTGEQEIPALTQLATCTPASPSRAWHTSPHPYLPLLATASSDKVVRIYSLTSFTLLTTISGGHKRSIRTCAWKPGIKGDRQSILATGSFDANVGIWTSENARLSGAGDDAGEVAARISTDLENEDEDEDFRFAAILEGPESEIKSVAWSCNGSFLATCSRDKSVWIWENLDEGSQGNDLGGPENDYDSPETIAVLQEHSGDVKCVSWHPTEENCLASSSYDEYIRIWREDLDGEWSCIGVCEGHDGTVWCIDWEPSSTANINGLSDGNVINSGSEGNAVSGPRIISCSADLSVRLWRRKPKERRQAPSGPRIPSIIRSTSDDEDWYEEGRLPQSHDRAVYCVAWSKRSKRVVTCGSDGKIVVYEEKKVVETEDTPMSNTDERAAVNGTSAHGEEYPPPSQPGTDSNWKITFETEAAHGVFEVNHVCWAQRRDRERKSPEEEIIVSTGDDGEVKIWTIED